MSEIKECPVIALVRATVRARCEALTREQIDAALTHLGAEPVGGRAPNGETLYPQSKPENWLYSTMDRLANDSADDAFPRQRHNGYRMVDSPDSEIQANQISYCRELLVLSDSLSA